MGGISAAACKFGYGLLVSRLSGVIDKVGDGAGRIGICFVYDFKCCGVLPGMVDGTENTFSET